jgi:hypothetical protein
VARERQKKKIIARVTAEMAERIVAAALAQPTFGADRLARLLGDEGVSVSRGLVYRTLRGKGLQTRELRVRFLEGQARLEASAGEREPKEAPEPPREPLPGQLQESHERAVSEPALEYPATLAPTPAEKQREVPAGIVPAYIAAPAGTPRIAKTEKAHPGKGKWFFRGINLVLAAFIVFLVIRIGVSLYDERQEPGAAITPSSAPDSRARWLPRQCLPCSPPRVNSAAS